MQPIEVTKCLHLKTACSFIGRNTILVNRSLIDDGAFHDFEKIDVPLEESHAGNALLVNGVVIMAESFPKTRAQLEQQVSMSARLIRANSKKPKPASPARA